MAWCDHAIDKLLSTGMYSQQEIISLNSNRKILTASAFSGIESPHVADDSVTGTLQAFVDKYHTNDGPKSTAMQQGH